MPDSFLFAILLTFLVMILSFTLAGAKTTAVINGWYNGVKSLMEFAFMVAWGFALGMTFVKAPSIRRAISRLAKNVKTPGGAYAFTIIAGGVLTWVNIYVGVFVAATLARIFSREVKGTDMRILAASAYATLLTWHGGLAGSIPLVLNTPGNPFEKMVGGLISTDETIFTAMNLITIAAIIIVLLVVFRFLVPKEGQFVQTYEYFSDGNEPAGQPKASGESLPKTTTSLADRIENNLLISVLLGLPLLITATYFFVLKGLGALNLLTVGFVLFGLAILAWGSPIKFAVDFADNVRNMAGIILQFPLYGGIMGIMMATGLAKIISDWFISISTPTSLPIWTFLSAGLVNMFVPSGGSQWAAQAPFVVPAAQALGVSVPKTAMAVAYGDAWTNMIQPFWTLLYLPIIAAGTRLTARHFMGFSLVILIISGVVFALGLWLLP
jgi:short-chain fatty acids transporter